MSKGLLLFAAVVLAQQDPQPPPPDQQPDQQPDDQQPTDQPDISGIATLLTDNGLTVLADALGANADLVAPLLDDTDGYTVFGPSDDVLGPAAKQITDNDVLRNILTYHVSPNPVDPGAIDPGTYVVDTALTSDGLGGDAQVLIVTKGDDDSVTIRHGGLDDATVTNPVSADGNFIHVIDNVLIPPANLSDVLAANPNLSSLAGALDANNLTDTVNAAQSITLFAPTNDAFTAFTTDNPDISPEDLAAALQYHVVPAVVYSPNVEASKPETLLAGKAIEIAVGDDGVTVNGANVTETDILTANGVIHIIDAVLSPANATEPEDTTGDGDGTGADGTPADSGVTLKASLFATLIAIISLF